MNTEEALLSSRKYTYTATKSIVLFFRCHIYLPKYVYLTAPDAHDKVRLWSETLG